MPIYPADRRRGRHCRAARAASMVAYPIRQNTRHTAMSDAKSATVIARWGDS